MWHKNHFHTTPGVQLYDDYVLSNPDCVSQGPVNGFETSKRTCRDGCSAALRQYQFSVLFQPNSAQPWRNSSQSRLAPPNPWSPVFALFRQLARKRDGGTIFPVRRYTAFVTEKLAQITNLRNRIWTFLVLPPMVAGTSQRLLLFRQYGVINIHQ